jgi:hypothetical protein
MKIVIALLGAAIAGGSAALAQARISMLVCQGGADRFEIEVDAENQTVTLLKTREKVTAKIDENYIEYTFTDAPAYVTNRIDQRTGYLYVFLNDKWQESPLKCHKKE